MIVYIMDMYTMMSGIINLHYLSINAKSNNRPSLYPSTTKTNFEHCWYISWLWYITILPWCYAILSITTSTTTTIATTTIIDYMMVHFDNIALAAPAMPPPLLLLLSPPLLLPLVLLLSLAEGSWTCFTMYAFRKPYTVRTAPGQYLQTCRWWWLTTISR